MKKGVKFNYVSSFKFILQLTKPKKDANLTVYKDNIKKAIEEFNERFYYQKNIILINITQNLLEFILIFSVDPDKNVTAQAIGELSKDLYNNKGLNNLSARQNKLFISKEIRKLTEDEFLKELKSISKTAESLNININDNKEDNSEAATLLEITDEEIKSTVEWLISTKKRSKKKSDDVEKIKEIIAKWIYID